MKFMVIYIYLVISSYVEGEMLTEQINELKKEIERKKSIILQLKSNDEHLNNDSFLQTEKITQTLNDIINRIENLENSVKDIKQKIFSNQNIPIVEKKQEELIPRFKEKESIPLVNHKFQSMDDDELEKFIHSTKNEPKSETIYKEP